jgi:uncharacterized RDD family membrane protein YckC
VPLDEHLKIDTPEQVALELPVAGIGSRFLAIAVDTLLQVALYIGGALLVLAGVFIFGRAANAFFVIGSVVFILFMFLMYWGYFVVFEILWSGRTPGKRYAGIRVIKESGRPINAYEAIGRNVLRVIDFLPAGYGVGLFVMLLNRHSRRLGDYVAGTVVVYERQLAELRPTWLDGERGAAHPGFSRVTPQELALVEAYLQRRFDLDPLVRDERSEQIAQRISDRTGVARRADQSVDDFLEEVARHVRDTARFR